MRSSKSVGRWVEVFSERSRGRVAHAIIESCVSHSPYSGVGLSLITRCTILNLPTWHERNFITELLFIRVKRAALSTKLSRVATFAEYYFPYYWPCLAVFMNCTFRLFSPALEDRRVGAEDLKLAVKLAIAPRGIFMQQPPDDDEEMLVSVLCFHQGSAPGTVRAPRGVLERTSTSVFIYLCYRLTCRVWRGWLSQAIGSTDGKFIGEKKNNMSRATSDNRARWQQNNFILFCFFRKYLRVNALFFSFSPVPASPPSRFPLSG